MSFQEPVAMQAIFKQIIGFVMKAFFFSVIFWVMWIYVMRPIANPQTSKASCGNQTQAESTDQEVAMKKYMEQAAKAEEQLNRMDAILAKKEEQSRRFDNVLSTWERQAKLAK
jgi:flagellar biosynthesis/type III secretory pathway M-ring protein FliF/YscJ